MYARICSMRSRDITVWGPNRQYAGVQPYNVTHTQNKKRKIEASYRLQSCTFESNALCRFSIKDIDKR